MKQNPKENALVIRYWVEEFFGTGNYDLYENFIAKDIQVHCPASWQAIHSYEIENSNNTKKIDQEYSQAFHFREMNIGKIIADRDKVWIHWEGEWIHKGDFFSIPATHRSIPHSGQTLYRFNEEGKIDEVWQSWDMLGLLKHIGFSFKSPQVQVKDLDKHLKKASSLSARERECLKHFLHGKTSKETAAEIFVSFRTVEYYFENIKDKLGCSTKRELYRLARIYESYNLL